MKLYRFSPIQSEAELIEAVRYLHISCNTLCKDALGEWLPNAGNLGIFCHYDNEYDTLIQIRDDLVYSSDNPLQKYFELKKPLTIEATQDAPAATYTHLYIRKPDIYRAQVGDIDFYLPQQAYDVLKQRLINGELIPGARIFPRNDLDMIELYNPDIDALGYVSTNEMSQKVHVKLSEETNL